MEYDEKVLKCFLDNQLKLVPRTVVNSIEEANDFLCECMAVVCESPKEVMDYFDENGTDISEMSIEEILEAAEVFDVGDGRYLIVEC